MANQKSEYVVESGRIFQRTTTETPIQVSKETLESLCEGVRRRAIGVVDIGGNYGKCTISVGPDGGVMWQVPILKMGMEFFAKCAEDGTVFPCWGDNKLPPMRLDWVPPKDLTLMACVVTSPYNGGPTTYVSQQFLIGRDADKRFWKLPMSNVNNVGVLCLGAFSSNAQSHLDSLKKALHQLEHGSWNRDWSEGLQEKNVKAVFCWKLEGDKVTQMPSTEWKKHSEKVAAPWMEELL